MIFVVLPMFNSTAFWKRLSHSTVFNRKNRGGGAFSRQLSKRFFAGSVHELADPVLVPNFEGISSKFFLRKLFFYKHASFGRVAIKGLQPHNFYSLLDVFFQKQASAWAYKNTSHGNRWNSYPYLKEISNFSGIGLVERIFFADRFSPYKAFSRRFSAEERSFFANANESFSDSFFAPTCPNTYVQATNLLAFHRKGFFNFDRSRNTHTAAACAELRNLAHPLGVETPNLRLYILPGTAAAIELPAGSLNTSNSYSCVVNKYLLNSRGLSRKVSLSANSRIFWVWFFSLKQKLKTPLLRTLPYALFSGIPLLAGLRAILLSTLSNFGARLPVFNLLAWTKLSVVFWFPRRFILTYSDWHRIDRRAFKLKLRAASVGLLSRRSCAVFLPYHKLIGLVITLLVGSRVKNFSVYTTGFNEANSFLRFRSRGLKRVAGKIAKPLRSLTLTTSDNLLFELFTFTPFSAIFAKYSRATGSGTKFNLLYFRRFKKLYDYYNKLLNFRVVASLKSASNLYPGLLADCCESLAYPYPVKKNLNANLLVASSKVYTKYLRGFDQDAVFLPANVVWRTHNLARFGVNSTHFEFFTLLGVDNLRRNANFGGYDPLNALRNHRNTFVSGKNTVAVFGLDFFDQLASFAFRNTGLNSYMNAPSSRFNVSSSFYFPLEFIGERFFNELNGNVQFAPVFEQFLRPSATYIVGVNALRDIPLYSTYSFFFFKIFCLRRKKSLSIRRYRRKFVTSGKLFWREVTTQSFYTLFE